MHLVITQALKRLRLHPPRLIQPLTVMVIGTVFLVLIAVQVSVGIDVEERSAAALANEPIGPVPSITDLDSDKVRLGEKLFHDIRLSHDNDRSCAACHCLAEGGDDGLPHSLGADGKPLDFNTPTVFNAALNFRLNWRGNFRALAEQAEAVLLNRRLMNTTWEELLSKLRADPDYRKAFAMIYSGGIEPAHVLDAIAAFERSLLTPNARFDQYLRGRLDAINAEEKSGYQLFKSYGCVACHQGVNVGGNLFQKFGIFPDPSVQPDAVTADLGRFTITGDERDRQVFRVPSLRNVAMTAPYFHDGRTPTLEEAVDIMARRQLGRALTQNEIGLIVKFLRTLTGEYRAGLWPKM